MPSVTGFAAPAPVTVISVTYGWTATCMDGQRGLRSARVFSHIEGDATRPRSPRDARPAPTPLLRRRRRRGTDDPRRRAASHRPAGALAGDRQTRDGPGRAALRASRQGRHDDRGGRCLLRACVTRADRGRGSTGGGGALAARRAAPGDRLPRGG